MTDNKFCGVKKMGIGTKFILNYLLFLQTDKTSVTQEAMIFLQKKN